MEILPTVLLGIEAIETATITSTSLTTIFPTSNFGSDGYGASAVLESSTLLFGNTSRDSVEFDGLRVTGEVGRLTSGTTVEWGGTQG